jgi:hypothetical protein
MTDTCEIDIERAAKAARIWNAMTVAEKANFQPLDQYGGQIVIIAARLAREGWEPTADPDLILARTIATAHSNMGIDYTDGRLDDNPLMTAILDALKRGRERASLAVSESTEAQTTNGPTHET